MGLGNWRQTLGLSASLQGKPLDSSAKDERPMTRDIESSKSGRNINRLFDSSMGFFASICLLSSKPMRHLPDESSYICDACGEEIVIPLDPSAGDQQQYVEDCPVCCRPNQIFVEYDEDGAVREWSEPE
jgi:hypothetical protein